MIVKLRKKPVEVETILWDGTGERADEIKAWVGDQYADGGESAFLLPDEMPGPRVEHAELWVAHNGSWSPLPVGYRVARELDGSGFYPLSPEGAFAGYEPPASGW
jgi:hypothetical protein